MSSSRRRPLVSVLSLGVAVFVWVACGKKADDTAQTSGGAIGTTTTPSGGLRVADVTVGRGVGTDKRISNETTQFRPGDTIYVSVHTTGAATGTPIIARWTFQDGQQVDEQTETISPTGDTYTEFHVSRPSGWPAGRYTVRILVNGQETTSKEFSVSR